MKNPAFWQKFFLIVLLVFLALFPRILDLNATRSPDEKRWLANTNGFVQKLAHGRLAELVQQPHPGITLQWLGAITIYADDWAVKKLPLVIGLVLLILAAGYIFGRLDGALTGYILIAFLAVNQFLFGHSRVYAMDGLLALFILLALGLLLLWKKTGERHYLIASGIAGAAATLSKLSGIIIAPVAIFLLVYWAWHTRPARKVLGLTIMCWIGAFFLGALLILPQLAIAPASVLGDFAELFRSSEYLDAHAAPASYYLGTLLFFSTPIQLVALGTVLLALSQQKLSKQKTPLNKETIFIIIMVAALFIAQMAMGLKKGDRYILPAFVLFDAAAALAAAWLLRTKTKIILRPLLLLFFILAFIWQSGSIWFDWRHQLSYVNPLTRAWFGERRHGWGEGLDLAAHYLNAKPNASALKVASYYPNEFDFYFNGEAVAVHQYNETNVDYVIIYRAMFERGPNAWETDVVNYFSNKTPEKIIRLSGVDMAWIYPLP